MEQETLGIGLEAIAVQQDKAFGKALDAWVEKARVEYRANNRNWSPEIYSEFNALMTKYTGMRITLEPVDKTDIINAGASFPTRGHLGNSERDMIGALGIVRAKGFDWFMGSGDINYQKGFVTGALSELFNCIRLCGGLFCTDSIMDVDEVTSIILHEVGHCFTSLSTIEYVILANHYLTDGIEAFLGGDERFKTKSIDAAEIMSKYITDKDLLASLKNGTAGVTEWTTAITMATAAKRREQFKSIGMGDRRDEQLADLYCIRQGYGRALVTGMAKAFKTDPDNTAFYTTGEFVAINVFSFLKWGGMVAGAFLGNVASGGVFLALTTISMCLSTNNEDMHYDRTKARFTKARNDLVYQLRMPGASDAFRKSVAEDIKAVDDVLVTLNDHRTLFDTCTSFINPKYRSRYQHRHQEEKLEALLNNSLFVTALSRK